MMVTTMSFCALLLGATAANPCGGEMTTKAKSGCGQMTETAGTTMTASYSAKSDIVDTAVGADDFNTLVAAVKAAGLVEALKGDGPFTVFAPTDAAFAALPEGTVESLLKPENKGKLVSILTYHVVPGNVMAADVVNLSNATTLNGQRIDITTGSGVKIDNANVVTTDIETSNGVIHVIDRVILPEMNNIPQVAEAAGSFGTLLAAVNAAGLAETLMGEGPFTVFAPTDEAFAALGQDTIDSLLLPENRGKLTSILTYHVVPGRIYSDQAVEAGQAETVQGGSVTITVENGAASVNNAGLVMTDIEASNGVIHVIDGVLIPE